MSWRNEMRKSKDKIREYNKAYWIKNKDRLKEHNKISYLKNRKKRIGWQKEYHEKNKYII